MHLDYADCEDYMKANYTSCISLCPEEDFPCFSVCNRQYKANLMNCPCNVNCPLGCPCPNFTCAASTTRALTTNTAALITQTTTTITAQTTLTTITTIAPNTLITTPATNQTRLQKQFISPVH